MELLGMYSNFDLGLALYTWLSNNHEGQFSEKYSAMCSLQARNIPDILDGNDDYYLAAHYYEKLSEDNWEDYLKLYNDSRESNRNDY